VPVIVVPAEGAPIIPENPTEFDDMPPAAAP
jgi:hypothetical protein